MGESIAMRLRRHQERRERGVPTVSWFVGAEADGRRAWQRWTAAEGRDAVEAPDVEGALGAWLGALVDPFARAIVRAAAFASGRPALELRIAHGVASDDERERLEAAMAESIGVDAALVSAVLAASPERLVRALPAAGAVARALERLALGDLPALWVGTSAPRGAALAFAAALAEACPACPVGLACVDEPGALAPRALSLLREGRIEIDEPGALAPRSVPRAGAIDEPGRLAPRSVPRAGAIDEPAALARQADTIALVRALDPSGVGEALLTQAATLASAGASGEPESGARARSAAELLLFRCLERDPSTAGRFELNGRIDRRFGPRSMEIDLLARDLALAIEIDGYHHFRDAHAFRRDRRKDWALQEAGYVVMRWLAEDVVSSLAEVLAGIRAAVVWRLELAGAEVT